MLALLDQEAVNFEARRAERELARRLVHAGNSHIVREEGSVRSRQLEPRSLLREVYGALCEDILNGTLAAGDALVEAQLAADLGVSKTPVREALIRLQRDGLVEITPYRGARVFIPSAEDVRQACELRIWLETEIVRKIAVAARRAA